jgi:hypothetical protein
MKDYKNNINKMIQIKVIKAKTAFWPLSCLISLTGCVGLDKNSSEIKKEYKEEVSEEVSLEENAVYFSSDSGSVGTSGCTVFGDGVFSSWVTRYVAGARKVEFKFNDSGDISLFRPLLDLLENSQLVEKEASLTSDCGDVNILARNSEGNPFLVKQIEENGCKGFFRKIPEEVRNSENYIWSECESHKWFNKFYSSYNSLLGGFVDVKEVLGVKEILRKVYEIDGSLYRCSITKVGDLDNVDSESMIEVFKNNDQNNEWESVKNRALSSDEILRLNDYMIKIQKESRIISINKVLSSDVMPHEHLTLKVKALDGSFHNIIIDGNVQGLNIPNYGNFSVQINSKLNDKENAHDNPSIKEGDILPPSSISGIFQIYLKTICNLDE